MDPIPVEARFSTPIQTGHGAHPASYTMRTMSFLGVKRWGRGINHPPLSRAEVKERVELYLYSATGPSWPLAGQILPLSPRNPASIPPHLPCTLVTILTMLSWFSNNEMSNSNTVKDMSHRIYYIQKTAVGRALNQNGGTPCTKESPSNKLSTARDG